MLIAKTSWRSFLDELYGRNTISHNIVSHRRGVVQNVLKLLPAFSDGRAIFRIDIALSSRARISTWQKSKTEATRFEDDECPLCRTVVGKPRRAFVKHVARHIEEIALMALPRNVEEGSEEGSVSTDRTSLEESRTSFRAKPCLEIDVRISVQKKLANSLAEIFEKIRVYAT